MDLNLSKGTKLLTIAFDQGQNTIIFGNPKSEIYMDKLFYNYSVDKEVVETQNFSRLILSALNFTQGGIHLDLKTLTNKQLHIYNLLEEANISISALKVSTAGTPKLEFLRNRRNLNRILLSQLLQKHVQLSSGDLTKIQESCTYLSNLKTKFLRGKTDKFQVFDDILYKVEIVLGTKIYKLALPTNFSYSILFNSHYIPAKHLSAQSHSEMFGANFYVRDCLNLAKSIVSRCVTCSLNTRNYSKKTSGRTREDELSTAPGHTYILDVMYLNESESYKNVLIFVCRTTSFIACIPIKSVTTDAVIEAI